MILITLAIGGLLLIGYLILQILVPAIMLGIKGATTIARKKRNAKEKAQIIESIESETSQEEREKLKDEIRREILREELRAEVIAESKTKSPQKSVKKKK